MASSGIPIATAARRLQQPLEAAGKLTQFSGHVVWATTTQPSRWLRWRVLAPLILDIGVLSIPVVAITGAFIGMILALESFVQFQAYGLENRLGMIINVSVVKQIGPVLAAVMVAGRVGGAMTAELGTMRVTEQLDAVRSMGADPIAVLVVPRVLACMVMTPILTVFSDLLGVGGGWLFTVVWHGVSAREYWDNTAWFLTWWEPATGLIKAVFFGLSIGLIACYKGFTCKPGAAGVGRATTESFVSSFLAIIVINLALAEFLRTFGRIVLDIGFKSPLS
ncbi:MAG: ABC transporter permease [Phycisphaerales bacterium]|jgi:phospholipid/cholesterol/gamma-HCH transport system permease protein|nr:ABC transporter permease [Phycisphaerales bacterium]